GARGGRAFKLAHARLEHRHRGIAEARILIARAGVVERGLGVLSRVVYEARGEEDRLAGFVEARTCGAAVDGASLAAVRPPRRTVLGHKLLCSCRGFMRPRRPTLIAAEGAGQKGFAAHRSPAFCIAPALPCPSTQISRNPTDR